VDLFPGPVMAIDIFATRFNPPFAVSPSPVFFLIDPFTEDIIAGLRKDRRFKDLAVAITDLTLRARRGDGAGFITNTGWNLYDMRVAGSMLKIVPMFASFRLRENLQIAINQVDSNDKNEVIETIERDWGEVVRTAINGRPDFPKIREIFTMSGARGSWNLQFTSNHLAHMKNSIGHSDQASSTVLIKRLGFQFMNGALEAEGLWSQELGGLWLGTDYSGGNWKIEPRTQRTHVGATAVGVATFLTLLEDDRLVGPQASDEMRGIMRLAGTWAGEGLDRARPRRPVLDVYGKVGIVKEFNDCAVVERQHNGSRIRYASVVLSATNPQIIRDLVVKLDDYIVASL
jgi:hypothetical protein